MLFGGVLVLVLLVVGTLMWIVMAGLAKPQAPRTSVERDIYQAEARVAEKPKDASAWASYADALTVGDRYAEARTALQRGRKAVGDQPAFLVSEARILRVEGDWKAAVSKTAAAVRLAEKLRKAKVDEMAARGTVVDPRRFFGEEVTTAELLAAEILLEHHDVPGAIAAYTRALAEDPRMSDVLASRADAYLAQKDYDKARAGYTEALKYTPDYAPALKGLAKVNEVTGK